jgi:hypothetical protein
MEDRNVHGRFVKGWKGGPGRPKLKYSLPEILREALESASTENKDVSEVKQIIKALFVEAKAGNVEAAKLVFNRAYGREPEIIQFNQEDEPDFSLLTDSELADYISLLEKATASEQSSTIH